ncbi:LamG domain-containing protein [Botrimarina mediterranea]|uniref:LamG domain-containing protein n=1 Tax=Botrimarina mediterranea TaxID=2528022 RepID=UPI00118A68FF|nr:hypothetical protein K2D_22220 [Planctomycetes bacterium K2D]
MADSQHNTTPSDELDSLLEQLALGDLDPAGWRRVGELIRGDRDAALRYIETAHYCETLRDETTSANGDTLPPIADDSPPNQARAEAKPTRAESSASRGLGPLAWFAPWGLAVSAAFFCGWLASGWDETPSPRVIPAVAVTAQRSSIVTDGDEPLGRVVGLTPVASSDGLLRSLKVGSPLGRGEVFQLTRGAARLEIADGEVLVQGPAEVSVIGSHTLFVRQGKVTVAHDDALTVQTPVAIVTGEAATYAVAAEGETEVNVTVIDGAASVHSLPRRGRVGASLGSVAAGRSMRVVHTGSRNLRVDDNASPPDGLLLSWDDTTTQLHPYERLVLSDEPLAYWPLYRVRRHRAVLDLTQHGFDGYAIGNWPTELNDVHASQPRGAYFDGESYIEPERKPPVDLRTGFTIESWARVSGGPEYQSVFASRWVLESNTEKEQCFGFTLYAGQNDKWQFWTGSGEYGKNWDQLHADSKVQRNQWTHVAASFAPDPGQRDAGREGETKSLTGVVRFYVNGEPVGEARRTMSLEDFAWPARIGAAEFVPRSLTSWLFVGELRDVALYDHVLPPERVQRHAEEGSSVI